jgi:ketosteroid isomerase-like protein
MWAIALSYVESRVGYRAQHPETGRIRPVRYFAEVSGNHELAERFIASLEARDWDAWAALLHPTVVYEIPQSRERIRGRERYLQFNQEYPGDWHLRPKVIIADERHGVVWFEWQLDGRTDDAMAFFEFNDGLIIRVTDFWPEPYEPPSGREHLVERW